MYVISCESCSGLEGSSYPSSNGNITTKQVDYVGQNNKFQNNPYQECGNESTKHQKVSIDYKSPNDDVGRNENGQSKGKTRVPYFQPK